jgi:hypothetical protein
MNPAVLDAFALIICAAEGPPAYPGIVGHEPDLLTARKHADAIDKASVAAPGAAFRGVEHYAA